MKPKLQTGRQLTDLELTTLGIVWKRAPCTAYAIMREFAGSTSSYYQHSAGSIYPLVQRLVFQGLLLATEGRRGRRPQTTYALSRRGESALIRWIVPPLSGDTATVTFDPLRVRCYFLAAVPVRKRLQFARAAERLLKEQVKVTTAQRERYRDAGDEFSTLAMDGAVHVTRARLAWMTKLRKWLESDRRKTIPVSQSADRN